MTRKEKSSNRKKENKSTVYFADDVRRKLDEAAAMTGKGRSRLVTDGLELLFEKLFK
ncbi:MAG: hypothetical protein U0835_00330 [Isosphaeraceae bacterium]